MLCQRFQLVTRQFRVLFSVRSWKKFSLSLYGSEVFKAGDPAGLVVLLKSLRTSLKNVEIFVLGIPMGTSQHIAIDMVAVIRW